MRRRRRASAMALLSALLLLVVISGTAFAQPSVQEAEPIEHVVERGDTLFRIAQRYNTTVEAIVTANEITNPGLIAVGQILIIPVAESEGSAGESSTSPETPASLSTYLVIPGDTLDTVARRFDISPAAIAELNGVVSPVALPAGGELRIPGQYVGRLHRVGEGETALGLALRYDIPLWDFLAENDLSSPGALVPGQRVWASSETTTDTLPLPFTALEFGPIPVVQGNTVAVKADLIPGAEVRGVFADEVLKFAVEGDSHYALFGIHALADPGVYPLALLGTDENGDEMYVTRSLEILDGGYGYEEIILPPERDAVLDPVALAAERARLDDVEVIFTPERSWEGLFLQPMDSELTSFFGTRRRYESPSYESYGYHAGTDYQGKIGDPVYAPAPGTVVLAEPLFVRGNAIVVDHGWGVFTGFWHLSQIDVEVGQRVEPGDQIGLVGDTGLSTGSHLHWDFWVNGTNVRALQWTEHPFP
jgi:murein DD-endopeptidase MepM/ murein hydrolase activator NlpD